MSPTSEFWAAVGVVGILYVAGILGNLPLLIFAGSGLTAWLLISAMLTSSTLVETHDSVSVHVVSDTKQVALGEQIKLPVTVSASEPVSHPVTVDVEFPAGIDASNVTLQLSPGQYQAREVIPVSLPLAGRFTLPKITVRYVSGDGLFTQSVSLESGVTITATPRGPEAIHVGTGGERTKLFGGHNGRWYTDRGDDVASTREYQPGDAFRRIDWKATARLDEPIVREFDSDQELRIHVVVDAQSRLRAGTSGRTKLDYLREVAMRTVAGAEMNDNPLSLTIVNDDGIQTAIDLARTNDHYQRARDSLLALDTSVSGTRIAPPPMNSDNPVSAQWKAEVFRRRDETTFTTTLGPYFRRGRSFDPGESDDHLFNAVQRHVSRGNAGGTTVIFTDDEQRRRLMDIVQLATWKRGKATVCLTPTVLFDDGADSSAHTFERLTDFEEYRRSLDQLPGVAALEVGPDNRLKSVLNGRDP
ncbi:DUF58 domain-containing protein [Salinigranum halophilum]|uniref:DUF58 domain-containing protein n=1 Tax=Salinigranum halophilum TaxID=2565931 RepID=UPI0010A83789|nr:DUF58 domain-containing protein [Salinigranum halophilum]